MVKKKIVLGSFLTVFSLLLMPSISAMGPDIGQIDPISSEDDEVEYYAVIVGCTRYQRRRHNIPRFFPFPESTMRYVLDALLESSNWKEDHIIGLFNEQATKDNILDTINDLSKRVDGNDVVVFQWMGHGTVVPDEDGDESDGYDEAICPYDTRVFLGSIHNVITDDELDMYLSKIPTNHQIVLIESCMSGGMADETIPRGSFADVGSDERVVIMSTPPGKLGMAFQNVAWPISFLYGEALLDESCDEDDDGWISAEEAFGRLDETYTGFENTTFKEMINSSSLGASIIHFLLANLLLRKLMKRPIVRRVLSFLWARFMYTIYQQDMVKEMMLEIIRFQFKFLQVENNPNMIDQDPAELRLVKLS